MIDPKQEGYTEKSALLSTIYEDAENNKINLITSNLSIAEVAFFVEERSMGLRNEFLNKIESLWDPVQSPIMLIDIHQFVVIEAGNLMRKILNSQQSENPQSTTLKASDAIHVASAIRYNAAEFHTYDEKIISYNN